MVDNLALTVINLNRAVLYHIKGSVIKTANCGTVFSLMLWHGGGWSLIKLGWADELRGGEKSLSWCEEYSRVQINKSTWDTVHDSWSRTRVDTFSSLTPSLANFHNSTVGIIRALNRNSSHCWIFIGGIFSFVTNGEQCLIISVEKQFAESIFCCIRFHFWFLSSHSYQYL